MEITQQHSLQACNTLGFSARAEYFCEARSEEDLCELLAWAREHHHAVTVLGGGSNVVLGENISGLVIVNRLQGIHLLGHDGEVARVEVGAGENWHELVLQSLTRGWYGLENLSLIPGSVGAAPIQNIGAYGVDLSRNFESLRAVSVADGSYRSFSLADCEFGYRDSIFKRDLRDAYVITGVTLRLHTRPNVHTGYDALQQALRARGLGDPSPHDVSQTVIDIRSSKLPDPEKLGNAGSFFKNPVVSAEHEQSLRHTFPKLVSYPQADGQFKLAAGWMIDQCGWKGRKAGTVGVHEHQALVLVHFGNGSAGELLTLANAIREDVRKRFAVELEIEPRVYA